MKFIAYGLLLLSAAILSQSMSISKRDTKDDLQKNIGGLKEAAKKEIEKLKGEGKLALATGVQVAEKKLEDIEAQLEKLNPTTELGKVLLTTLEALAKNAEEKLKAEIKKLSGLYYDEDLKNTLLIEGEKLKKTAQEEIEKLKKEGKTKLAGGLEAVEKRVLDIETQLKALTPSTEVGKAALSVLESLLKKAETALEAEIKKLSGSFYDTKDDLQKNIGGLKEAAKKEIEKLKGEGKLALATGLQAAEKRLEDIEAQLEKLNPTTEIGKTLLTTLEALAKNAEEKLKAEIKKLSGSYYDEDLKNTLLIEGEKLKKTAQEEIEKLKKQGKAKLATGIEAVEKRVLDIETQLKALTPSTEVGKAALSVLESLLKKAETALEAEIKKLSGSFYDTKDDLQKNIGGLKEAAKKEIEKLKGEGKLALATGLQAAEKKLEDIEAQLEKLNPTTELGKVLLTTLEALAKKAEEKLKAEITKLSGSYYDEDLKNTLLIEGEKLKKMAQEEIEKLKKEGKAKLAQGIEAVEKRLLDIEGMLNGLNPSTEIGKAVLGVVEGLLKKAETALENELKKLSGSYYDDDLKNTLLIEGEKLKKMAQEEVEKLKKEGKTKLAAGIVAVEKRVVDIEAQLKALNPSTEVGKALLTVVESSLKKAETALEAEIKKLSGSF